MKVWVIRDLEPISIDPGAPRLMRAGILSMKLAEMGHQTVWYTSSFNHYTRKQRLEGRFSIRDNLTIDVIKSPGYSKNISFRRIYHNFMFAHELQKRFTIATELPDIIIADLPTTESAAAAVKFGLRMDIPTVVTVRDLWPDFFSNFVPSPMRRLVQFGVYPLERQAAFACKNTTSLIGISKMYLKWGQNKGRKNTDLDRIFPLGYSSIKKTEELNFNSIREKIGSQLDRRIVSFVGSWGNSYDIRLIYQAAMALTNRKDVVFVLAGDSSGQPRLERKLRKLSNVILTGWLDQHQVASLLKRSAIGILPYKSNAPQGLPNKLFEYMAYGAFQISTLGGEAKEVLEETQAGVSIRPGSVEDLVMEILKWIDYSELEEHRCRRIEVYERRYSREVIYSAYISHMEEVIDQFRRGANNSVEEH